MPSVNLLYISTSLLRFSNLAVSGKQSVLEESESCHTMINNFLYFTSVELFLIIAAVIVTSFGLIYHYYSDATFSQDLPLVREKNGVKRFSIGTRASFYFNCSKLYRDIYEGVLIGSVPSPVPHGSNNEDYSSRLKARPSLFQLSEHAMRFSCHIVL